MSEQIPSTKAELDEADRLETQSNRYSDMADDLRSQAAQLRFKVKSMPVSVA